MMGRILAHSQSVFTFKELHFFGGLWVKNSNQKLTRKEQINLLSRLFCIQSYGLFNQEGAFKFNSKSAKLLGAGIQNPLEIYKFFLDTVTKENGAKIACEQTPQNAYYLQELLDFFPKARVINLVRDQRDVLLSQKNKWRRRFLGAKAIPILEALRSFVNYHPILTAKVWASSLSCTVKFFDHPRVKIVKFEDLLTNSETVVQDICEFLQIEFEDFMLDIPVIGSSTEDDTKSNLFIDRSKINKWKNGGLSRAEIYLSQIVSSKMMKKFDYKLEKFWIPPLSLGFFLISFPVKLVIAFCFNIHRMGNIVEVIKKRFFIK